MSSITAPRPLHLNLTAALVNGMLCGGGALLIVAGLTRGPLILLAALMSIALGMIAGEVRRNGTTVGVLVSGPAALAITIATAATWPLAWPGERLITVAVVAVAAGACTGVTAISLYARRPVSE